MTALANKRSVNVKEIKGKDLPVAGGVRILMGAAVFLVAGYLRPAGVPNGKYVGLATETADNRNGVDGDLIAHVEFPRARLVQRYGVDGAHPFTQANVGGPTFFLDDQTVSPISGTGQAGTLWEYFTTSAGALVAYVDVEDAAEATDVAALTAIVTALQTTMASLQASTAANTSAIATLQGQVVTLQGQVSTLQASLATVQSNQTTDEAAIASLQASRTTDEAAITSLQTSRTTDEANIATNAAAIAAAGGFTSVTDVASAQTVTLSGANPIAVCTPGTGNTCAVKFPPIPAAGNKVTIKLDLGAVVPDGNGHNVESPSAPGTFAATTSMTTDTAPSVPRGTSFTWAYDAPNWKLAE